MTRSDQLVALVRTFVPAVVGLLLAALAKINANVDNDALAALVDAVFVGGYYTVVRFLEAHWPALGVLLGIPRQPTYTGPAGAS